MTQRSISATSMLFASVSAILGSGWLFSAYYTSLLAGPAALVAWLLGGLAVIIVAFVFAELSAMLPITGSSTRIPQFTHGTVVSFIFSWMIWLSYAALVATEVQAVIQYLSFFYPTLTHPSGALTANGYTLATALMLATSALNIFSLRWLIRCNNVLTCLKIIIPLGLCLLILAVHFSTQHVIHPAHQHFAPFGAHGIFSAIATGGIVFAFNGFKQACELAGEAQNPNRAVPFAIIGSVVICLIIYLILQLAFLSSLTTVNLPHDFAHLILAHDNSPFASILAQDRLGYLQPILYVGAIIGPLAAGLMYMGSASRSLLGKSQNGYLPLFFQTTTEQGNPLYGILFSFIFGMLMFAPLPGWNKMIAFLTSLMAISYAIAPICLLTLRQQVSQQRRPFQLPFATAWSHAAFMICNLMTYFSGWQTISKLGLALLTGLAVLLSYHYCSQRGRAIRFDWRQSLWMWPYFIGLTVLSYLGNFGGGIHRLPFGWDCISVCLLSILVMRLAVHYRLPNAITARQINALNLNH